jgi:hypothetical protein
VPVGVRAGAPKCQRAVTPGVTSAPTYSTGVGSTGATLLKVPVRGLAPIGSGVQSNSDRKSKEDEGGSEIVTKGKEDSSKST